MKQFYVLTLALLLAGSGIIHGAESLDHDDQLKMDYALNLATKIKRAGDWTAVIFKTIKTSEQLCFSENEVDRKKNAKKILRVFEDLAEREEDCTSLELVNVRELSEKLALEDTPKDDQPGQNTLIGSDPKQLLSILRSEDPLTYAPVDSENAAKRYLTALGWDYDKNGAYKANTDEDERSLIASLSSIKFDMVTSADKAFVYQYFTNLPAEEVVRKVLALKARRRIDTINTLIKKHPGILFVANRDLFLKQLHATNKGLLNHLTKDEAQMIKLYDNLVLEQIEKGDPTKIAKGAQKFAEITGTKLGEASKKEIEARKEKERRQKVHVEVQRLKKERGLVLTADGEKEYHAQYLALKKEVEATIK